MEWFNQVAAAWRQALFALLRGAEKIPRHVAFIMDGNRRFANKQGIHRLMGHEHGCEKFVEVVRWCLEVGVQYVSVYAFSIENFKRSSEEVEELMQLARQAYKRFKERGLVDGFDPEVRVIGDLARVKGKLQSAAARLMRRTQETSNRPVINICFSYTSSQEVCRAVDICRTHVVKKVTEEEFESLCFTNGCPDVDLVIRTSGETRLSDFLNLQCRNAKLIFDKVLWPDYSLWHFISAILSYSRDVHHLEAMRTVRDNHSHETVDVKSKEISIQDRGEGRNGEVHVQHQNGKTHVHSSIQNGKNGMTNPDLSGISSEDVNHKPASEPPCRIPVETNGVICQDSHSKDFSLLLRQLQRQKQLWIKQHARRTE